jgi:hypothetical protein
MVQRSIDIIDNSLTTSTQHQDVYQAAHAATTEPNVGRYLPAFPFSDPGTNYGYDFNQDIVELDGFSLLNCFPDYSAINVDTELYMT